MITNPPPTDFSTPCPSTRRPDKPSVPEKFKKPFKEVLFKGKKLNVTDKTYKVYFGKKANHKCRYFKAISYNRRMGRMEICVSSAIEPVVLEDSTGGVSQKRVIRMLREFKPLENLETNGVTRSFLSGIKQLTRLQSLTITLDEKQMIENCSVFRGLRALSNVHLVVKKNKDLQSTDREGFSLSFFRHLLSKETLKALKLELQNSLIFSNSTIVEELLYYISQSKATMFNVQVRLKEHNAFNLARISEFLAQVDFLALQFTYRSRNNEYKNRDEMLENFGLNKWLQEGRIYEELNSAMSNSQKALRIQYKRRPQMDVSLLLAQCMALHSLCLQWKNYQPTIPKEFKFAKGLRNLYLGFQQLKDEEIGSLLSNVNDMLEEVKSIEGLNIMLDSKYFGQQSLTELYGIYQQISSKGIKNHCIEIFDDCFTGGKNLKPEALEILSEEMRCMRNLDRLKMYFNGGSTGFLREMQMTLSHYEGLRYLDMLVFSQYHTETNFMFPFESLSGLVELRMRFIGPLVKRCAEHLAKNLGFLKDIEVLEISEGCLYNTNLDTFVGMMKKLNKMHRLKELNIQVPDVIDEEEEYERQRKLFGGENYESFTAQLGKDVRDLYRTNECLEKACLYFQQNFYLDIMTERQVR